MKYRYLMLITIVVSMLIGSLEAFAEEDIKGQFDGYHGDLIKAIDHLENTGRVCAQYETSMNDEHITCVRGSWHLRQYIVTYMFNNQVYIYKTFVYPNEKITTDSEGTVIENDDSIKAYH